MNVYLAFEMIDIMTEVTPILIDVSISQLSFSTVWITRLLF